MYASTMNDTAECSAVRSMVQFTISIYHTIMKKANTGTPANSLLRERRSPVFTFADSIAVDAKMAI